MNKINFITSKEKKAKTLETILRICGINAEVACTDLSIVEPQLDTVAEVSKHKALEAYKILKKPVVVEDGGMCIDALNGFPGVYTKYAIDTIGAQGIVNLMDGKANRKARFESVTTYINENGELFQFEKDGGEFEIAQKVVDVESPFAWSEFWKIIYFKECNKALCEFSEEELYSHFEEASKTDSLQKFAKWYGENKKNV